MGRFNNTHRTDTEEYLRLIYKELEKLGENKSILSQIEFNVTSAQLLSAKSSPFTVIPAPGVGKAISVKEVLFNMKDCTSAYVADDGDAVIGVVYTGETTHLVSESGTTIGNTDNLAVIGLGSGGTLTENTGIDFYVSIVGVPASTDLTGGDGNMDVTIKYEIINI